MEVNSNKQGPDGRREMRDRFDAVTKLLHNCLISYGERTMMNRTVMAAARRIRARRHSARSAYLERVQRAIDRPRGSDRMGCANVAHAFAALPGEDKLRIVAERAPHIGIVTAYNDMLS